MGYEPELGLVVNVSKKYAKLRREAGLSIEFVADYCGINKATVANFERGFGFPVYEVFVLMCEAIGTTSEKFFSKFRWQYKGRDIVYTPVSSVSVSIPVDVDAWLEKVSSDFCVSKPVLLKHILQQYQGNYERMCARDDRTAAVA